MNLSIVTPTLNAQKFLEQCLLSTLPFRVNSGTHLLVDSGSFDETLSLGLKHGVSSVYCPPGNMYHAINTGIRSTSSIWVTYINSDDLLYHGSIASAFECLSDDYDVIYGNIDYVDSEGRFLHHWLSATSQTFGGLFSDSIMPFPQPGAFFRRSLWEKLGGFNECYKYSSDFDFFLRAFLAGARFGYFNGPPVAAFRLHSQQISQNQAGIMRAEAEDALRSAGLGLNFFTKLISKMKMRNRNLFSYLVRTLRHRHLYGSWRFSKTISNR